MLIIDGTDGVGKTTLTEKIWAHPFFQARAYELQHLSRLPNGHDRSTHYVNRMNRRGIFDRFVHSEWAYCYAREEPIETWPLTLPKLAYVQHAMALHNAFTVFIYFPCEDEEYERTVSTRGPKEEMYDPHVIKRANEWFANHRSAADIRIELTPHCPFIHDSDVQRIIDQYIQHDEKFCKEILNYE